MAIIAVGTLFCSIYMLQRAQAVYFYRLHTCIAARDIYNTLPSYNKMVISIHKWPISRLMNLTNLTT